eukprot:NODE_2524_length_910_cov_13.888502_g2071_i0.p3 GENE.NODE_2524_length_910_cov_13.888502_g2071_i0~~NODE_2524_length_910_cov_13.888502_g2071_i0.p3  ORF type:complete len:70 (-),score=9.74 NODE_2524_length_910_cov_13.888502_g2071_i0:14-223(-)
MCYCSRDMLLCCDVACMCVCTCKRFCPCIHVQAAKANEMQKHLKELEHLGSARPVDGFDFLEDADLQFD